MRDGEPWVFEAVQPVKVTPWSDWVARGEDGHVVVLLEEKELRNRFGDDYVRYSQRVPRFIPQMR